MNTILAISLVLLCLGILPRFISWLCTRGENEQEREERRKYREANK